ncbi:MAG: gliding motility-associated C-terminal domain-containing protein [Flavobacteriales bacterium]|nr:gliding motility-associated C-terminal domain-containing protein [Flavobacteriales bacterium]
MDHHRTHIPLRLLGGFALWSFGLPLLAQPCSINIGPDVTICQGQIAVLTGPAGYSNYLWDTGALTQNMATGVGGPHWCQVSYPSGNLVTNSNFNAGNSGFSTQFNLSTDLTTEGTYYVGTNPNTYHPQFNGAGTGNFLIVNAGWTSYLAGQWDCWCQTVPVCPNQTYTLSYRGRSVSPSNPARLQWWVDGNPVGLEVVLPVQGAAWQTITTSWTSAPGQTSAGICLRVMSGDGIGNDFGLDDITMSGTIVLRDTAIVNVTPLPVVNLGPNQTLCAGTPALLNAAVPGGTYLWQDGSTGSTFNVTTAGLYNVTVTANNCPNSDAVQINYNPYPVVDLGNDTTLCAGQSLLLDATVAGATYLWQDGSTAATYNVTGAGAYSVTVTLNNCPTTDAINVAYNPLPVVALGNDTTICNGSPLVLNATYPGATYLWQDGSTAATIDASAGGNFSVTLTLNGCTASDARQVNVNPVPVVDLGNDTTLCTGQALQLDATVVGATYLWQDGSTAATYNVTGAGTYSVTVTLNNCPTTDAINVAYNALPVVALGNDTTICDGSPLVLNATYPGATYLWQDGSTAATIDASAGGNFSVTLTLNGCTASDARQVNVNPVPVVDLGNDTTLCAGQALLLDATVAGATYLWQDGSTAATYNVTGAGAYSVTVTLNNCLTTDAINVGFNPLPVVALGNDTTICNGSPLVLNATYPGATYLWQDGSTAATINASAGGNFSVTLTLNGCTASDSRQVNVNPVPVVDLGNDTTLCAGQALLLEATVAGATYLWQDGSTTATYNVTGAGAYSVIVTLNNCLTTDAINVGYNPLPVVALGNDTTICNGSPLVLNATYPGATYLWQDGSTAATIDASAGGNFSVTLTLNGCTASDARQVNVNPVPVVDLGNDTIVCAGAAVTFNAFQPGATYLWQDGTTGATLSTSGVGNVSVTVTVGGCSASDAVALSNFNLQAVNLGPDTSACAGSQLVLGVSVPGATYLWSTGATTSTISVGSANDYWLVTSLNGCQVSDTVNVAIVPLPVVSLGNDTTLCPGDAVLLDATTVGATYLWNNMAVAPTLNAGPGSWSVMVTVNGCSSTDVVSIGTHTPPTISLGNDTTLCPGATLLLNATIPGGSYLWQNGSTASSFLLNSGGNFTVTVTDANTCSASDAITVTYATPVAVDLGNDTTICLGTTLILDATVAGASYAWNTGAFTPTLSVSTTGVYSVSVMQGNCTVSDAIQVSTAVSPVVDLGNDTTLCPGATLLLDAAEPGASYQWQNGPVTSSITVVQAGTYSVTVTNIAGCSATDAITVQYASPNAVELGNDTTICQGNAVLLDATLPGSSYLWSTGATTAMITVTSTGTYAVTVMQGACTVNDAILVSVLPSPIVDLGNDTTLCAGATLALDATWPAATYIWSTGATTNAVTTAVQGDVWVAVTAGGCTTSDTITVNVLSALSLDLGNDTTLCPGTTLDLTALLPGGVTTWSTGVSATTITVSQPSTVWATVSVGGCAVSDTIAVAYTTLAPFNLGPASALCSGQSMVLDATTTAGASYLWDDGSTSMSRSVSTAGTFWAQATLANCVTSDTIAISLIPLPAVDLGPDTALCPGASMLLDATTAGGTYLWSNGSTLSTLSVAPGGWNVTVTVNGCSNSDAITIGTLPPAMADLGGDTTLCLGASMVLDVTQTGATYMWQNGSTASTLNVVQAGTYSVTVDLGGCTATDAIAVSYFTPASLSLGPDTMLCPGNAIVWSFNLAGASYLWSDGSTGSQYSTSSAGTVWVQAGAAGCMAMDTVQVGITQLVQPDLGDDASLCAGDSLVLSVTPGTALVQWSTGATSNSITATTSATYTVTLTIDGCSASDAVELTFLPVIADIDLGPDRTLCPGQELELDAFVPGAAYEWSTGGTDASLTILLPGTYSVTLSSPCATVMDTVLVTEGGCAPFVHVPNSFTPNGDGINEVFAPLVVGSFIRYELTIFDRWGEAVFSSTEPGKAWDGLVRGTPVQDGVYVWTLAYKAVSDEGVDQQRLTGHVTLLR